MMELGEATRNTLRSVARTLFPFDRIGDEYYDFAVEKIQSGCNEADLDLFISGAEELHRLGGKHFWELPEERRVELLKEVEATPFFKKTYGIVVREFFNNPALWPHFDYEGPSSHKGGYRNRGFDRKYWAPP